MKEQKRCQWVDLNDPLSIAYHDKEWGIPVHDDRIHFEFLILEGAQAGLSWQTILKRRENYRQAFENFDPSKVALFNEKKIERLLSNPGIIRNRLKITSAIQNAKQFLKIQNEFGSFDKYIWQFVKGKSIKNSWKSIKEIPAFSEESMRLSKDLKMRGFNFVGPTIIYAHMQAVGLVNDHIMDCFCYESTSSTK